MSAASVSSYNQDLQIAGVTMVIWKLTLTAVKLKASGVRFQLWNQTMKRCPLSLSLSLSLSLTLSLSDFFTFWNNIQFKVAPVPPTYQI